MDLKIFGNGKMFHFGNEKAFWIGFSNIDWRAATLLFKA